MTPLTRVQITQRNRARRKIMKDEFGKQGISERRLYIDDLMYKRFEELAKEESSNVNVLIFRCMREYLRQKDTETTNWDEYYFLIESAVISARIAIEEAGLGDLREAEDIAQKSNDQ